MGWIRLFIKVILVTKVIIVNTVIIVIIAITYPSTGLCESFWQQLSLFVERIRSANIDQNIVIH